MENLIVCPSGLAGRVRGLKGREMAIMSNKQMLKSGAAFDELLKNCWLETTDPGVYGFTDRPVWPLVYLCDRFYALLQIRAMTFGDDYEFKVRCQECDEPFNWRLKVSELPVRSIPDNVRAKLRENQNEFDVLFAASGHRVWFKLLNGRDEQALSEKARKLKAQATGDQPEPSSLLLSIAARITKIDGVEKKMAFIEDCDFGDLRTLRDEMEKADGGVETDIEVSCKHCEREQEVSIPFAREFFNPKAKRSDPATLER
jgi:hypothetical protein